MKIETINLSTLHSMIFYIKTKFISRGAKAIVMYKRDAKILLKNYECWNDLKYIMLEKQNEEMLLLMEQLEKRYDFTKEDTDNGDN